MSIVKTLDVFCDFPECLEWTHGVTGGKVSKTAARTNARREAGWAGCRIAGGHYDLCPEHAKVTADDIVIAKAKQDAPPMPPLDDGEWVTIPIADIPVTRKDTPE